MSWAQTVDGTTVQDYFETYIGMDLYDFKTELRQELDPGVMLQDYFNEFEADCGYDRNHDAEWAELTESLEGFVSGLGSTRAEVADADRDAELEYEADTVKPDAYYRNFQQDVTGRTEVWEHINSQTVISAREYKQKVDNAFLQSLTMAQQRAVHHKIMHVEYGSFDMNVTTRAHAAWLHVKPLTLQGKKVLSVGVMHVFLDTGVVECKTYGCKFSRQLTHKYETDEDGNQVWNREWAEYQVLSMFAHMGSHQDVNSPWPRFVVTPTPDRDSDDVRMANRSLHLSRVKTRAADSR